MSSSSRSTLLPTPIRFDSTFSASYRTVRQSQFEEMIEPYAQRMRDAVISAVQRSDLEQLRDPSLGWLKAELLTTINRSLQMRILRDIVFTDFSFEKN